ncbi:hypothetical protein [Enterobacter roggenkampii]|uniref:hypothetical protein n=1 Tax=Enterobacter roggenkampii TaxID=1812935 RepID=UPI000931034F|nr:hypothetical protein [Enterobacter roggenkampii]
MITEKDNVFYCDCGFSFQRNRSGAHDCADGLRNKLAESEARCAALAAENAGLKESEREFDKMCVEEFGPDWVSEFTETPATDAFLAEVRAHDLNAFIRHHSAELDAHIKNGGEQFDEKSVRIRDIIVSARLFREQIRKEAAQ